MEQYKGFIASLFSFILLVACSQPALLSDEGNGSTGSGSVPEATVEPIPSQDLFLRPTVVTRIVTETPPAGSQRKVTWCLNNSGKSDEKEPWKDDPESLSQSALIDYLQQMGVVEICLPPELGMRSLELDWNATSKPPTASNGRRIEITFNNIEGLAIIFATYDLDVNSDFSTYATIEDYNAVRASEHAYAIVTNETPGYVYIDDSLESVQKAYVFPFRNHYVALVYNFDSKVVSIEGEALTRALIHPPYPAEVSEEIDLLDDILSSIKLREMTPAKITADSR